VHVVQELGSRDESAVENGDAIPNEAYADDYAGYDRPNEAANAAIDEAVNVVVNVPLGASAPGSPGRFLGPRSAGPRPWTATSPRQGPRNAGGTSGGSSGGNLNLGNIGGGGGSGDDLAVFAIVLVAAAVMAAAGLAVTEGLRYDGFVQIHPEQALHLKEHGGTERTLPLAMLTPADVAASQEAIVRDDETFGFRFAGRAPLNREGFAFKVDMGSLSSLCACYSAAGLASNIQFGYFPHQRLGLLTTLALGGGKSPLNHTFQRHSANLEVQYFPFNMWRLHLGGFGHGGMQVASDELGSRTGQAWGGGAILEVALTTRLALTGRIDYTAARTAPAPEAWASTSTFTAGVSIY
jgi:hypothetical protein